MKLKYQLRGLGIGIIVTAILMGVATSHGIPLTDAEIRARALELGMVESGSLKLTDVGGTSMPSSQQGGDLGAEDPEGEAGGAREPSGSGAAGGRQEPGGSGEAGGEHESGESGVAGEEQNFDGSGVAEPGQEASGAESDPNSDGQGSYAVRDGDTVTVVIAPGCGSF